jgi:hypothetical protein
MIKDTSKILYNIVYKFNDACILIHIDLSDILLSFENIIIKMLKSVRCILWCFKDISYFIDIS